VRTISVAAILLLLGALGACGASSSKSGFTSDNGGGGGGNEDGGAPAGDGAATFRDDDVVQQPPEPIAEVYGHSADTLYRLDPDTKAVTVVGNFKGCSSVIDIALDANSKLFGTTFTGLWVIDKSTATCTQIGSGSFPNSLSFVPKGTVDANAEALVGYEDDVYVRMDTTNGNKTKIGAIGGGFRSSGDIVSVKNGPTYLTVKGPGCNDCLLEVDPKTGALKKNWGSIQHVDVFGLAFWAGTIYGFDNGGELFEVHTTGGTLSTSSIPIPGAPRNLSFWGAGSTTSAPVVPTK
jgi:hypothetical protein